MNVQQPLTFAIKPTRQRFLTVPDGKKLNWILWRIAWHVMFRPSPGRLVRWRVFLLNRFGAKIHPTTAIAPSVQIDYPWNLSIQSGAMVYHNVNFNCNEQIHIGHRVRVSQYTHLTTQEHDFERRDMPIRCRPIDIGDDVWIGADTYIGPGVTIGSRTIIGARAGITSSQPSNSIIVGNPAKSVKPRPADHPSPVV